MKSILLSEENWQKIQDKRKDCSFKNNNDVISFLINSSLKGSVGKSEVLPDKSGLPQCSREQQQYYEQNWERVVNPRMTNHMRGSKDVLHDDRDMMNDDVDWDLLSKKHRKHAIKIEKKIDKSMGIPVTSCKKKYMNIDLYHLFTDKELESQYKKATRGLMSPLRSFTKKCDIK